MQLLPWASVIPWDPSWLLGCVDGQGPWRGGPSWPHWEPCGRAGALAWWPLLTPLRTPLGAVWMGRGPGVEAPPDPPRGSLCLSQGLTFPAYKNGWFRPRNLEMSSRCLHHPAQEDQWQYWWWCDDGHAYGAVTVARPCAECSMNMFSPNGHKNPTESELLSVFQGRKWRWERLIFVFKVTQLVRKWAGIGTQSFLTPEPMLFTDLLCCQGGREVRSPDSVQG